MFSFVNLLVHRTNISKIFYRGIRNIKVCKVNNFQVWLASRYFSKVKKGGEGRSAPLPIS